MNMKHIIYTQQYTNIQCDLLTRETKLGEGYRVKRINQQSLQYMAGPALVVLALFIIM